MCGGAVSGASSWASRGRKALRQTADRSFGPRRCSTESVTAVKHNRKWKLIKGFSGFQASVLLLI